MVETPIGARPLDEARHRLRTGDRRGAAALCRRRLAGAPDDGDALLLLGMAALGDGRAAEAAVLFTRAASLRPGHAQAHANRAAALRRLDRNAEALAACRHALALEPAEPALLHNLATLCRALDRGDDTIAAFRRLVRLAPHNGAGFQGLTDALRRCGDLGEAVAAARALAALHPDTASALGNLGILLQFQGGIEAAMACYARALAIDPGYAEARSNLGLARLLSGDLAQGWIDYADRWKARANDGAAVAARLRSALPAWDGGPLGGGKLLAWGELGVGDEILLAGMIPDLAARGVPCVLEAAPRLVPLFARSFPGVAVVPRPAPAQPPALSAGLAAELSAQCSLGDLGRWLRPDFSAFPRRAGGYLKADPERTAALRARYRAMAGGNRLVGISWHSANPLHRDFKSAPLALWAPVLRLPGITFVDLQYGDRSAELEAVRRDQGVSIIHDGGIDPLADLDGFAAQVAALDLVISISNTTVHVAGALGVPVWTLLARQTGFLWCWFRDREDSPWYPSMRLYRQAEAGDWTPVFERVRRDLGAVPVTPSR